MKKDYENLSPQGYRNVSHHVDTNMSGFALWRLLFTYLGMCHAHGLIKMMEHSMDACGSLIH